MKITFPKPVHEEANEIVGLVFEVCDLNWNEFLFHYLN